MRMRRALLVTLVLAGAALASATTAAATPVYQDPSYSPAERAADLVSRMTLAEKASQTVSSQAPAIPRLGIPAYGWWNEALHGVSRLQTNPSGNATVLTNTTSYPIDQSLGASWDPDLIHRVANAISDEAREVVPNNTLDLDFYSPTMNLERDPRWGRNDEAYGEDPYLVSQLVSQFVDGLEGKDSTGHLLAAGNGYYKALATIKHYAANNSEINRRTGSSDMDERTLREYYTDTFRRIVQQAQPGSVMSSYNEVNGVPAAASVHLLDTLLRQTFGFQGYVTSDCDAIFEIVAGHHWQPPLYARPVNNTERHAFAMSAGEDLDCNAGFRDGFNYLNSLPAAVNEGIPTQVDTFNVNDLDTSLVRLFTARFELGEFDDPGRVPWVTQARARVPQGTWTNSDANNAVTETPDRLALAREAGDKSIVLLKNADNQLPLHVPSSGPFKVAVIGPFANPPASSLYLGGYSSNQGAAGQAKEVNGYQGIKSAVGAIDPDAQVDFYKGFTGTGTTATTFTNVDPAAVAAAAGYDEVIVYAGTDQTTATEDRDRSTLALPGAQASLINQVAAANPHTIVYMETIGPVDVTSFKDNVPAMLWSSYNGQRKGEALADVLLGSYDPSGRLPSIWYQSDAQIPDITDYAIRPSGTNPGRTYMYFKGPLTYPFGYGLSYTKFSYSHLQVDKANLDANDSFRVSVDVTNTGSAAGSDVVQLYVSTPDAPASAERPIKRLEGFQKVSLAPGQTRTVTMTVNVPDLAFFDNDANRFTVDGGRYGIQIATSSADADVQQQQFVRVHGDLRPELSVVTAKPEMTGDAHRDVQARVMFPEGVTVDPNLTVAMNDDSLYGFVERGQSKDFPPGMTFSYSSDRPSVVAVDGHDTLRTGHPGVATITATARYHGATKSTTFVVRVVSELSSIRVDGRPLTEFDPDVHSYDVTVPDDESSPQVSATAPGASVDVTQAAGVPGRATITVTTEEGVTVTYVVHFAHRPRSDDFGTLGPQWSWIRNDTSAESVTGGSLAITPQTGDLNGTTNTAKNILVQPAVGDWTITSKLAFSAKPHANNQQGGIIAYQGDDDYLKLDWEFSSGAARLSETVEDSQSGTPVPQVLTTVPTDPILGSSTTVWLRMRKRGPRYTTYYSTDGSTFMPIYEAGAPLTDVEVGLFAYNRAGTTNDLNVAFDDFDVTTP